MLRLVARSRPRSTYRKPMNNTMKLAPRRLPVIIAKALNWLTAPALKKVSAEAATGDPVVALAPLVAQPLLEALSRNVAEAPFAAQRLCHN